MNPPDICPLLFLILQIAWIGSVVAIFAGVCFGLATIVSHWGK